MTHRCSWFRSRKPRHTWLGALVLTLLPIATAAAQELPQVRVTRAETLRAMRHGNNDVWKLSRAEVGTVYEFLAVEGDEGKFAETNYYLVLLPRDAFGTQWLGWISGRNVEPAPPRPQRTTAQPAPAAVVAEAPRPVEVPPSARPTPPPAPSAPTMTAMAPRLLPEVVLRFAFDRSDLSETAKETLATALKTMSSDAGSLSFALGGHADAAGTDAYNQKLGLARAEQVRKFIAGQLQVPAERISVSSFGESQPVAPNTTRAGRAENRRVVVTVTAAGALASR